MKTLRDFRSELNLLNGVSITSNYYRFMSIKYLNNLLNGMGAYKHGGRFNLPGSFEVIYLAPDPHTAITEVTKDINFKLPPQIIVTINVNVQNILDLQDRNNITRLGLENDRLLEQWRVPRDKESFT